MNDSRLPDFVIIGAAKCGTTSLAAYLNTHDRISMSAPKELRFFSDQWDRGLDWYSSQFTDVPAEVLAGEASPQYTQAPIRPDVPNRMASVIPDAKLIYMVRDPVDQMRSFFRHLASKGREGQSLFDEAVKTNPIYLATASYGFQLRQYLLRYPQEQILVVASDELRDNRTGALERILSFLGVGGQIAPDILKAEHNTASDKLILPSYLSAPRAVWRRASGLTGHIPRRWRQGVRNSLSKPPRESALALSPDSARWLRAKLEPDFEMLDSYGGPLFGVRVELWLDHLQRLESGQPVS